MNLISSVANSFGQVVKFGYNSVAKPVINNVAKPVVGVASHYLLGVNNLNNAADIMSKKTETLTTNEVTITYPIPFVDRAKGAGIEVSKTAGKLAFSVFVIAGGVSKLGTALRVLEAPTSWGFRSMSEGLMDMTMTGVKVAVSGVKVAVSGVKVAIPMGISGIKNIALPIVSKVGAIAGSEMLKNPIRACAVMSGSVLLYQAKQDFSTITSQSTFSEGAKQTAKAVGELAIGIGSLTAAIIL